MASLSHTRNFSGHALLLGFSYLASLSVCSTHAGFHLDKGGQLEESGFFWGGGGGGGGMMVKAVTMFHKCIWGPGMLECVCVCVRFHTGF